MGIEETYFKCGHCGKPFSESAPPKSTNISNAVHTAPNVSIMVLSCDGCDAVLGAYSVPMDG
jgi:hypothetical protein